MGKQGARIAPLMKAIKTERGLVANELLGDAELDDEKQLHNKPAATKSTAPAKTNLSVVKPLASSSSSTTKTAPVVNVWNRRTENKTISAPAVDASEYPSLLTSAQMVREQKEMAIAKGRHKTPLDSDDDETVVSFDASGWVAVDPSLLSPVNASAKARAAQPPAATSSAAASNSASDSMIASSSSPAASSSSAASSFPPAPSSLLSSAAALFPSLIASVAPRPASSPAAAASSTNAPSASSSSSAVVSPASASLTKRAASKAGKSIEPPGGVEIDDEEDWTVL